MTVERTEEQSPEEQRLARELSRGRTRPPLEVPGYEARQFLGAGAYGEVWVALDQNTGRRVAIKFYTHRGGLDLSLLAREVEKLVFLSADRYVVQLLDVGWDANPPYYVMEYIENGSLEDYLEQQGPLPVGQAVEIFRDVATGLLRSHGKGVLHCDLKPANILLDQDHQPRLADFGQSRLSCEQTPALGTLFFMAPEQADLQSVPDARWDVYALGALLHCMLTGQPPYRNSQTVSQIDSTPNLQQRLQRYRELVCKSRAPDLHQTSPGRGSCTQRHPAALPGSGSGGEVRQCAERPGRPGDARCAARSTTTGHSGSPGPVVVPAGFRSVCLAKLPAHGGELRTIAVAARLGEQRVCRRFRR